MPTPLDPATPAKSLRELAETALLATRDYYNCSISLSSAEMSRLILDANDASAALFAAIDAQETDRKLGAYVRSIATGDSPLVISKRFPNGEIYASYGLACQGTGTTIDEALRGLCESLLLFLQGKDDPQ